MKYPKQIARLATLLAGAVIAAVASVPGELAAQIGVPLEEAPPAGADGSKYFYGQAQQYEIRRADETAPLKLTETPLLNWTNPARTNEQGILVVWLKEGRPEALSTLFTYQVGQRVYEKHELLSLSSRPLIATFCGQRAWTPTASALQAVDIGEAPAPSDQARVRSLQMRRIARDFTGTITQREGETTTLRSLPQPLYRYQDTTGNLLDGAIFSLNVGTDPEVLIVLEADRASDSAKWKCGLARLHFNELKVERLGKLVWTAQPAYEYMKDLTGQQEYMNGSYFTYYPRTLVPTRVEQP